MMSKTLTFFSEPSKVSSEHWKECGTVYQALAIALSDIVLTSPLSAEQPGVNRLLKRFFQEHALPQVQNSTSAFYDYKALIRSADKTGLDADSLRIQLIDNLSQTLHAMTLEALYRHPTSYHEYALPSALRAFPRWWVASSAPAIIADHLGLSIHVLTIEAGKSLHASMHYEPQGAYKRTIELKVRHGSYSVKVSGSLFDTIPTNKTVPKAPQEMFERLAAACDQACEETLKKFNEVYKRMAVMVQAGELSKTFLQDLYIHNLSFQRLHAGTQAFFDSIHIEDDDHAAHMIPELLHAIARMIALGDIDERLVFENIDGMDVRGQNVVASLS